MDLTEKKIKLDDPNLLSLFNYDESYLRILENRFRATVTLRGDVIIVKGDTPEVKRIEDIFKEMKYLYRRNGSFSTGDLNTIIDLVGTGSAAENEMKKENQDNIIFHGAKDIIRAKTPKQLEYLKKVMENDIVFSIGPAGTGKTFLAVAMALAALRRNEVGRLIISRPAVEAGESLGFLPGDLREKIDPYLRPITDALHYMLSAEKMKNLMEKQTIEITPLAYMRGRTLNNSFIILDEAQNATITQMKMFLTRLGASSRAIITGDVTQIDLPDKSVSGLINAKNILQKIKGIGFVYFDRKDVVRHRLVAEIIKAYEHDESGKTKKAKPSNEDDDN